MRYLLKKARRVVINDIATKKHMATMVQLTQAQLTGASDIEWATGEDGARLAGFDQNKTSGMSFTSGVVSTGVLEAQTGGTTVKVANGTGVLFTEEFTIGSSATSVTLKYKASGAEGNEVKWIYKLDSTGEPIESFAQKATVSATAFAYDDATKAITLPTGQFVAGDRVRVDYHPTFTEYTELTNEADKFSVTGEVYVDGFWHDTCLKKDVALQMYCPAGKVSGEIDLSFGDTAATQNLSIEALTDMCDGAQKTHWKLFTYDMEDVTDATTEG